jgi:hypothetical protein
MPHESEIERPTRSLEQLTFGERLVIATLEHRVTRIRYNGHDRVIEPQLLGIHEAGEPMLVAYQIAGASQSAICPGGAPSSPRPWKRSK